MCCTQCSLSPAYKSSWHYYVEVTSFLFLLQEVAETSKLPKRKLVKTRPSSSEHESVYEELDFSVGEEEPMANGHGSPEEYPGTTASSSDANEARFVRETRKGGVRGSGRR